MNNSRLLAAALLLALPVAARAQTKPAAKTTTTAAKPATEQVTEVTEDLDPATGKVIRRTTRTTTLPAGTPLPSGSSGSGTATAADGKATDSQVSDFFREKTTVGTLTAPALLDAYSRFIEQVRADRRGWKPADWSKAAAVLSSLNGRYDQLRSSFVLDDKVTIRSQQAEFQTLRTARQLSDQVSDKL